MPVLDFGTGRLAIFTCCSRLIAFFPWAETFFKMLAQTVHDLDAVSPLSKLLHDTEAIIDMISLPSVTSSTVVAYWLRGNFTYG